MINIVDKVDIITALRCDYNVRYECKIDKVTFKVWHINNSSNCIVQYNIGIYRCDWVVNY